MRAFLHLFAGPLSVTAGLLCLVPPAGAQMAARRPVVVELFTSQGCSSCPPADALVADLAEHRPDLLAPTFHVTYWNSLSWTDPFSLKEAIDRQRGYVALSVSPEVYTPAMVVDGALDVIGSDRPAVAAALARAKAGRRWTRREWRAHAAGGQRRALVG